MADEQDEWLDRDAAEKLLRGEPVVPPGAQARSTARSLAETLDAARSAPPSENELAGEESALAAFRQVGPARGAAGTGRHRRPVGSAAEAGTDADAGTLDPVRLGTPPSLPRRRERPRFGRPVRIGLVASLAGCALGGVAVAAGTGALAGAFGGAEHGPANTVSVAASPDASASRPSGTGGPSGTPEGTGAPSGSGAGTTSGAEGDGKATPGTGVPDGHDGTGGAGGFDGRTGGYGFSDRGASGAPDGYGDSASGSGWFAAVVEDCHDYRDGHLGDRERRRLAQLARGERNIPEYCATLTDSSSKGSGAGDGPDGADTNGAGDGSGRTGGGTYEGDQDTDQPGQFSSSSLRKAPADGAGGDRGAGPAVGPVTTLAAASGPAPATTPAATPAKSATKSTAKSVTTADVPGGAWSTAPGAGAPTPAEAGRDGLTVRGGTGSHCGFAGYAAPAEGTSDPAASGWI
ncbi:hypothetical protein [Streptomyces sp. NBC_00102]|uniref:hypothetical protein n=1 Tax=Streptomyces sp. NBC_00102 TaxID=2975652 RepID=UPI00225305F2|nr:hypothetical protein [Streptomyces sp. NBC_00102]MCX5399292.1 hypothetical protein [Streptomyces sp. NBC_00102]